MSFENNRVDSKEVLNTSQRRGELIGVAAILLVLAFFAYHQTAKTGFFTAGFGPLEMSLAYGSLLFSTLAPITRSITGRRNPARPVEGIGNMLFLITSVWLLWIFPFSFAHLADPIPASLRFTVSWISNDVGMILLGLGALGGVVFATMNFGRYRTVHHSERESIIRKSL